MSTMNNEITVTVNLSGEDRKRLDAILDALQASRNCERCANTVANAFSDFAGGPGTALKRADPAPVPTEAKGPEKPEKPEQPQQAAQAQPQRTITVADIRALSAAAIAAGKKAQVKEIISRYADSISGLPESCLTEVHAQLTALKGESKDGF